MNLFLYILFIHENIFNLKIKLIRIINIAITDTMSEQHEAKNLHLIFPFLIPSYFHINIRVCICDSKQYYFRHKYYAMRSYFRCSMIISLVTIPIGPRARSATTMTMMVVSMVAGVDPGSF